MGKRSGIGKTTRQQGTALVAAVVFIVVMGFLGVTASFLFNTSASMSMDSLLSMRAFYAAEAGLEWGIKKFQEDPDYNGDSFPLPVGAQTYQIDVWFPQKNGNQATIQSKATYTLPSGETVSRTVEQVIQRDPLDLKTWKEIAS